MAKFDTNLIDFDDSYDSISDANINGMMREARREFRRNRKVSIRDFPNTNKKKQKHTTKNEE